MCRHQEAVYNEFSIFQSIVTYETVQELAMMCRCDNKLHDSVCNLLFTMPVSAGPCWRQEFKLW